MPIFDGVFWRPKHREAINQILTVRVEPGGRAT